MKAKSELAKTKTFKLSPRLSVTFTLRDGGIDAVWDPTLPARLTDAEAQEYRRTRGIMLERLAQKIGGAVICVG
jgi:hypothetical protein